MSQEMQKGCMPYRLSIICASLLLSLVLYQFYVELASPQVPYMDTMMFFVQIDQIFKGEISWLDVYGSGEHRGLIYPFITFVEWKFWNADARISTMLTGFVVAAIFYFWLNAYLNAYAAANNQTKKAPLRVFAFCVIAAVIVVSPAGFELWTLDLGFAQLCKNLLIVHFLYLLSVNRLWSKKLIQAFAIGLYGGFLILFATYGWSYPFLIACLFAMFCSVVGISGIKSHAFVVVVILLIAQVLYVYSGHGVFSSNKSAAIDLSIIGLLKGVLYGAGTAFIGGEVVGKIPVSLIVPMVLGAAVLVVALLAIVITLFERTKEKIFLSSLLVFSLTVLAGVSVARGFPDFTNTGASRYFVDYIWLLLAPLAIIFATRWTMTSSVPSYRFIGADQLRKLLSLARILALLLLIAALIGHAFTWLFELKTAPYRAVIFKNMAEVYRKGVANETDAALLQAPFSVAKQGVAVAQFYNLAVLGKKELYCALKKAEFSGDWYGVEINDTRWMGRYGQITLGNCASEVNLKGYIPKNFRSRSLRISYGDKNVVVIIEPGKEFSLRLDQMEIERVVVTLEVDHTTSPLLDGIGADQRELGMLLTYIGE